MNEHKDGRLGFSIGHEPTLGLSVTHLGPTIIPAEDWHRFRVDAEAPGFQAKFECETFLRPLKIFADEIRSVHKALSGAASLTSTDRRLNVEASIDRLGHVVWKVALESTDHPSPRLTFNIEQDQTFLLNVAAKIEGMLETL
ncbi:MAG: DUF6228 family protein [Candidatus Baltobacteraceae bacterium]